MHTNRQQEICHLNMSFCFLQIRQGGQGHNSVWRNKTAKPKCAGHLCTGHRVEHLHKQATSSIRNGYLLSVLVFLELEKSPITWQQLMQKQHKRRNEQSWRSHAQTKDVQETATERKDVHPVESAKVSSTVERPATATGQRFFWVCGASRRKALTGADSLKQIAH